MLYTELWPIYELEIPLRMTELWKCIIELAITIAVILKPVPGFSIVQAR